MRVDQVGPQISEDPSQAERGREVHFVRGRKAYEVVPLARAPGQLAVWMGDEHRAVAARAQAQDRQEGLVLSAAPRPGGVDVEREHASHSFTNFSIT
jgi:hypothetical protein